MENILFLLLDCLQTVAFFTVFSITEQWFSLDNTFSTLCSCDQICKYVTLRSGYKRVFWCLKNPKKSRTLLWIELQIRVSIRKTFAQFLRNEAKIFSFFAHQFCAKKQQFAQSFAKVISRKIAQNRAKLIAFHAQKFAKKNLRENSANFAQKI